MVVGEKQPCSKNADPSARAAQNTLTFIFVEAEIGAKSTKESVIHLSG
jgi:hypothetical protein